MRERVAARNKLVNKVDPVYFILDRVLFKLLFKPPKTNAPGEYEKLTASEEDFLLENLGKHRIIVWANILYSTYLGLYGIEYILTYGNTAIVVTGLLAPAMISGIAWFTISLKGTPEKFIGVTYYLTMAMFLSFSFSMVLLTALLIAISPWIIGIVVILPIYVSLYIASLLYDNIDGLKIGLDTTLLKFSRANLNYYRKHGLSISQEAQEDSLGDESTASNYIALFTYYLKTLDRNLEQLERERGLTVANHIIASSTDLLFCIVDLFNENGTTTKKDDDYEDFIMDKYLNDQDKVDELTLRYLGLIVGHMKHIIDDELAKNELTEIEFELSRFTSDVKNAEASGHVAQHFADHRFSQTFRKISELASAYRHVLFNSRNSKRK